MMFVSINQSTFNTNPYGPIDTPSFYRTNNLHVITPNTFAKLMMQRAVVRPVTNEYVTYCLKNQSNCISMDFS